MRPFVFRVSRRIVALALVAIMSDSAHAETAEQATAAAIARVTALNPAVNAVIALDPTALDQARALDRMRRARGPLFGLPVLIKDNIETAGPLPTTAGSLALAANVSGHDALLVAGLRAGGAVILGKTNLSEWANIRSDHSISGWSAVGGQTRNPHALDRTPCGSSSGSAAAVASGMVTAAIGTETDGSVTCPAAITGIVGLKPTVGLVSRSRVVPISHSQDTPGPLTIDVTTAAKLLTAIAGSDSADPATKDADAHRSDYAAALRPNALKGARIGVVRWIKGWSPAVTARFDAALAVLKAQGATLVDVDAFDREGLGAAENVVLLTEFKADLNIYLATATAAVKTRTLADVIAFNAATPRELALFGQDTFIAAQAMPGLDDPAYLTARATSLRVARGGLDALFAHFDALVSPTRSPAGKIDAVNGDPGGGPSGPGSLAAVAGTPHLTVPMGAVAGLPVGLSFMGPAWSEARLLGYGYAYEQAAHARVTATLAPSVETSAAIAPLLAPERL